MGFLSQMSAVGTRHVGPHSCVVIRTRPRLPRRMGQTHETAPVGYRSGVRGRAGPALLGRERRGRPMHVARRAVVTGGAGFLGSWLCELLLAEGWRVLCVDNFLTGDAENVAHLSTDPAFTLVEADVSQDWDVDGPCDLVLHLASAASPVSYLRHPLATMRA